MAEFLKTLISFPNKNQIDQEIIEGQKVFNSSKANCGKCHGTETLDQPVDGNIYVAFHQKSKLDSGLFLVTKDKNDLFKFRIPSLINVAKTSPYLHDGSVDDISYFLNSNNLSVSEKTLLKKYLLSLTDSLVPNYKYYQKPNF